MNQSDFKLGAHVRIVDSSTDPTRDGQVGTVTKSDAKYQFRVAVQFYLNRDSRVVFFHPSELELIED